jgi:hypothetical protein
VLQRLHIEFWCPSPIAHEGFIAHSGFGSQVLCTEHHLVKERKVTKGSRNGYTRQIGIYNQRESPVANHNNTKK